MVEGIAPGVVALRLCITRLDGADERSQAICSMLRTTEDAKRASIHLREGDPIRVCSRDFGCADEQWTTTAPRLCSLMGQGHIA